MNYSILTSTDNLISTDTLKEDAIDASGRPFIKKWKIVGEHPILNGFIIVNGSTSRIIFPEDFDGYYL